MKSTQIQTKKYWAIVPNAKIIYFMENDILFIKIQWICHFVILDNVSERTIYDMSEIWPP